MNPPRVHASHPLPSYYSPIYQLKSTPFSHFFLCAAIESKKANLKGIRTSQMTIVSVTPYVPSSPSFPPPAPPSQPKRKALFNIFSRRSSSATPPPPVYKETLQPLSGKYRDAILPSNFQYSRSIFNGMEYRCRNIGSDGWEKVVKGMLLTGSPTISHHSTHTPFVQLQEILHSSHSSACITLTPAGKEKGLPPIPPFPIPTWVYNSTCGSLRSDVCAALMLAVATKVKDLHQSKYAHRNINSETVWVSIAFQPTNCTEEDIVVDLRGEEISEDLVKATSNSQDNPGLGMGVFRIQTHDIGYTGPRWLRCLSSEVADSEDCGSGDLENDDPTVERIRVGNTRGYIPPETIKSCGGSSSVGSSSGKSVSRKSTAEDAFALGALLRDICTGVPPHVTVEAYKRKWTARLATPAHRQEAEKTLLGITDLASVDFDCLKLMRGLLNSDKVKRLEVADIFSSPFIKKHASPTAKPPSAPIIISKPSSGQEEIEGVPGYIKDEFNTLMKTPVLEGMMQSKPSDKSNQSAKPKLVSSPVSPASTRRLSENEESIQFDLSPTESSSWSRHLDDNDKEEEEEEEGEGEGEGEKEEIKEQEGV
ncbi:hypothetical protein TrVE_jg3861 [Triparma verrucosa]|uniref:Protein kinase domain-containing protein n=1 Tax=Triparma verrucosa TaxID=1606542 RepID=A0A9W7BYY3_9STRA|nr:hypothetical protein TrVE_jg3861 [Triparma verrucosa]